MRRSIIKKFAAAGLAVAMLAGASSSAFAALTLKVGAGGVAGDLILGEVIPGLQGGGLADRDQAMITTLLGMALGQRTPSSGANEYDRSITDFGSLPAVTQVGMMSVGSSGGMTPVGTDNNWVSVQLPANTTYQYLAGAWDGPNGGLQVWYIGNVAAGSEIWIPRYVEPDPASGWPQNLVQNYYPNTQYGITTWTMFNPTPVPEPTTMIAGALLLLPFAASTVRFARKNRKA